MARNVFILGAGASREAGGPLMYDFLDMAEDLYLYKHKNNNDPIKEDFERVFQAISDLQLVYSKSYLDSYNIETLFGIVEMAQIIQSFVDYSPDKINKLRSSMINVIVNTLESYIKYPIKNERFIAPYPYVDFAEQLRKFNGSTSIITFNYDCAIDYALYQVGYKVNYYLDNNTEGNFTLLKLHGSINWGQCPECKTILPLYLHDTYRGSLASCYNNDEQDGRLFCSKSLTRHIQHKECNNMVISKTPVLVPPTWNKKDYHGDLTNVWVKAAQELSEAVNIIVVGYSLPETDSFFRYLYALGTMGKTRLKNFILIDPDKEGTVEKRFQDLIGRGIERRFKSKNMPFDESIRENVILETLKAPEIYLY